MPHCVTLPPDREIVAIDISEKMLRRANPRRKGYRGTLRFVRADASRTSAPMTRHSVSSSSA